MSHSSDSPDFHKRIPAFDGLRGIAVLFVVVGHARNCFIAPQDRTLWWSTLFIGNSTFGVMLFFVLSGYLITGLLLSEQKKWGSISLPAFYMRRSLRIVPAFVTFLIVIAVLMHRGAINISVNRFLSAAAYLLNYSGLWLPRIPKEETWFLGHLWTLAIEEQFYLIWPLAFRTLSKRHLRVIPILAVLILPIIRVVSYQYFPAQRGMLSMMFHTGSDGLFMGCAFALWRNELQTVVRIISAHSWSIVALLVIPGVLSPLMTEFLRGAYAITVGTTIDALCAAVLILSLHLSTRLLYLRAILENSFMTWLGRISYSLYLWQQLFINPYAKPWNHGLLFALFSSLGAAMGSYYLIELPALRLKTRFLRTGKEPRTASPVLRTNSVVVNVDR